MTVFGTASRAAKHHAVASSDAHTFVYAADRAFFAAALMLMLAVALVANMRTQRRPAEPVMDTVRELEPVAG